MEYNLGQECLITSVPISSSNSKESVSGCMSNYYEGLLEISIAPQNQVPHVLIIQGIQLVHKNIDNEGYSVLIGAV